MLFPGALAQSEVQTTLSKIWTRFAGSIFYSDNRYTFFYITAYSFKRNSICNSLQN